MLYQILDEGLVCHLGFIEQGKPFVIPTMYARLGETLYVHGPPGSRMLSSLSGGVDVCLTVTLLDGLVLARSAFSHSMKAFQARRVRSLAAIPHVPFSA